MKCPGCPKLLAENDWSGQRRHMERKHPDILDQRMVEFHRWDGWEQD